MDAAEIIASRLFMNGFGEQAHRLVLMSRDGRDLGGWCMQAVIDHIRDAAPVSKPVSKPEPRRPKPRGTAPVTK